jgi:hypothetical protein
VNKIVITTTFDTYLLNYSARWEHILKNESS